MTPLYRTATLAALCCLLTSTGCQTGRYRAATLPDDLRAAPIGASGRIHLPNLAASGTRSTAISPGDLLDVRVVSGMEERTPEPLVLQVSDQGEVDLPFVGAVGIKGMKPAEASVAITRAAVDRGVYRRPSVTIEFRERATYQVTVIGAVNEPGVHELPIGDCNVLAAIAQAGGLTEEAGTEVELMRQTSPTFFAHQNGQPDGAGAIQQVSYAGEDTGPVTERINLAMANSATKNSQQLGDRDVVMVPPRDQRVFHVAGLVKKPDQFELPDDQDLRVLDAIAMAGGRSSVIADKVYVVRQQGESDEPAVIQLSIAEAKKNGKENLILAPGDLVSIESTPATTVATIVESFFRVSLGFSSAAFSF